MGIRFKSIPEMWEKEFDGRKPNTVRKIDYIDGRFCKLLSYVKDCTSFSWDGLIEIKNTETQEIFKRRITDVSIWKDLMIISWKHEEKFM